MDNLHEIIQSMQKQNQAIIKAGGLSGLTGIAESIRQMNKVNSHLAGLEGISEVVTNMAMQKEKFSVLGKSLSMQMPSQQLLKKNWAFFGLSSTLLSKQNQLIADKLGDLGTSQLAVPRSLGQIAQTMQQYHWEKFDALGVALQGIYSDFFKKIAIAKTWEDFDIAEEANGTISHITEETLSRTTAITQSGIDEIKTSILKELTNLLSKSNSERARHFIIELITIIGFLLTLYNVNQQKTYKSNAEVIFETKNELEKLSSEFSKKISVELQKLNKSRVATTNVNLRYAAKKNCEKIGLVKKGQIVTVIEIRHKYLLISYIDFDTEEPRSGFVLKKYFRNEE